ncbi:MAG: hypothetical protein LBM69_01990 [Lachnospiraceae bacterium]|jgi:hypothetical protein|nr:hypothetical protein [Lachnospiraceae bacterium]
MKSNEAINFRNPAIVRQAGFDALIQNLGVVGTVYFLRQLEDGGHCNYTEERGELLKDITLVQRFSFIWT